MSPSAKKTLKPSASVETPQFPFVIRDPLLGDIRLTAEERQVLDSDVFQRQRGVKQLGTSMLVYPSAMQTRFVHALGNLQIMGEMVRNGLDNSVQAVRDAFLESARGWLFAAAPGDAVGLETVRARVEQVARIAGMCHDLGHFPMSHVFEYALAAAGSSRQVLDSDWNALMGEPHEYATLQLIRRNGFGGREPFDDLRLRDQVALVVELAQLSEDERKARGPAAAVALAGLVSSEVDSDRAEYLRRDSYVTGAGYGNYDIEKLVESFVLVRDGSGFAIRPSTRALQPTLSFLMDRVHSYRYLYYHSVGVLMDGMIERILTIVWRRLAENGMSRRRVAILRTASRDLAPANFNYARLLDQAGYVDDATLWSGLRRVAGALAELEPLKEVEREARRLRAYLRAVLRRERLWVALWKREEEYAQASQAVLKAFTGAVARSTKQRDLTTVAVRRAMARKISKGGLFDPDPKHLSALNFVAHGYPDRLRALAEALEKSLLTDRKVKALGSDMFVEVGTRHKFKPIRNPRGYKVVSLDGRTLVPLAEVARSAVEALQSLWFDGIQMRLYVISERALSDAERQMVRERALTLLPEAIDAWYTRERLTFELV